MVVGLAEQLIVGGSNAFTVNARRAICSLTGLQAFLAVLPSLTVALTVYEPGSRAPVAIVVVVALPDAPVPLHE